MVVWLKSTTDYLGVEMSLLHGLIVQVQSINHSLIIFRGIFVPTLKLQMICYQRLRQHPPAVPHDLTSSFPPLDAPCAIPSIVLSIHLSFPQALLPLIYCCILLVSLHFLLCLFTNDPSVVLLVFCSSPWAAFPSLIDKSGKDCSLCLILQDQEQRFSIVLSQGAVMFNFTTGPLWDVTAWQNKCGAQL